MTERTTNRASTSKAKKEKTPKQTAAKRATVKKRTPATTVAKKPAKKVAAQKSTAKKKVAKTSKTKNAKAKPPVKEAPARKTTTKKTAKKVTKRSTKQSKAANGDTDESVSLSVGQRGVTIPKRSTTERATAQDTARVGTAHRIGADEVRVTIFSRVKTENAVLLVARVLGLAFIAIGAASSVVGISRLNPDLAFLAPVAAFDQKLTASLIDSTTESTVDSEDTTFETKPEVVFDIAPNPIAGMVTVHLKVQQAEQLFVKARSLETDEIKEIGVPEPVDPSLWRVTWDTTKFLDGEYELVAYVTNSYGGYQNTANARALIENAAVEPVDETTETGSETDTTTTTTEADTASDSNEVTPSDTTTEPDPTATTPTQDNALLIRLLTDLSRAITTNTSIVFEAEGAQSFKTFLKDSNGTRISLPLPKETSLGEWQLYLDISSIPAGEYELRVTALDAFNMPTTETFKTLTIAPDGEVESVTVKEVKEEEEEEEVKEKEGDAHDTLTLKESKSIIEVSDKTLAGVIPVLARVEGAAFAEFYVRPQYSLTDRFAGLGKQIDANTWRFRFDTTDVPNGTYELYAKHRNALGYFTSEPITISIQNENPVDVTKQSDQEAYATEVKQNVAAVPDPVAEYFDPPEGEPVLEPERKDTTQPVADFSEEVASDPSATVESTADRLMREYEDRIRDELRIYGLAVRENDEEERAQSERRLRIMQDAISAGKPVPGVNAVELKREIERTITRLVDNVRESETLIRERVGDVVTTDSDGDGLNDYDEINLYETDPFRADTDGDGFVDSAEIESGFNPLDPSQEAAIAYESPKETGVLREDILQVKAIITDTPTIQAEGTPAAALITGTALPNSFVTLYIFSTPIIVTVRTNDDGSWSYRFEKELEDGTHEVYVGVTDNAGKIVAKSNPFTFVKEAEAFTPVDASASNTVAPTPESIEPSFANSNGLLVAAGGVVSALGFILLIASLLLNRREAEGAEVLEQQPAHA